MEKILIILMIVLVGCSTQQRGTNVNQPQKIKINQEFGNFDKVYIPNEIEKISKMISIVQPELKDKQRIVYASSIHKAIKDYKIEPQIIVALIDTESNFIAEKISSTGDLSIAQVNTKVWNKEFVRLKLPPIDEVKLKEYNQEYAIKTMAKILNILKTRHQKNDRRWYARYHSNTKKYKHEYLKRIEIRMKMLTEEKKFILAKS